MRINSIVNRYIFLEMMSPFCVNLLFFTFVFLLTEILEITHMIVNYKIGLGTVILMLAYSMPYFLVFVIPLSVMMAVLLTFLKMSGDNEVIALKSSGVSLWQIMPSVLAFCAFGCALTSLVIINGLPWGRMSLKELTIEVAKSNIDIGLKERTFNNSFKGVMLYVNKIDMMNKELIDVFIQDERSSKAQITIIAPRGKLFSDPEKLLFHLRLFDGTISQVHLKERKSNAIRFDTYDINLDLHKAMSHVHDGPKDEKEMSLSELQEYIKNSPEKDTQYYSTLLEFHKKFSIPWACFALGILAVPLGIQSKRAKKSFGLALGMILFLFYYLMLSTGLVFGEAGVYPPIIGMWVPNIVTGGIGLYLMNRTVKGRPTYIEQIPNLFKWLRKK